MKNIAILIHKKRDDLRDFLDNFPETYIYTDWEIDFKSPFLVRIQLTPHNDKNILGSGIRNIYNDLPEHHVVIVNDCITIEDVKILIADVEEKQSIIIATSDNNQMISKKKKLGVRIITKLFNLIHRQKAVNVMSNAQAIPSFMLKYFLKLRGDICNTLITERFIIKDHNLSYRYTMISSSVFTDTPDSISGYIKCSFIIGFVFIKFMLSSLSAFLVDNSLSFVGYNFWSPLIVRVLASLTIPIPSILLDVEIVSTGIARVISSIYNYVINKKVVFVQKENVSKLSTACKYFTLVLIIWIFSTIILKLATTYFNIPFVLAKVIADVIMYFVSFIIQRDIIFKKRNK